MHVRELHSKKKIEEHNTVGNGHRDMGTGPHQVLAATLTLFQPEGGGEQIMPII